MVWNMLVCRNHHVILETTATRAVVSASHDDIGKMFCGWCGECGFYIDMVVAYNCLLPDAKRVLTSHNNWDHSEVIAIGKLLWRDCEGNEVHPFVSKDG